MMSRQEATKRLGDLLRDRSTQRGIPVTQEGGRAALAEMTGLLAERLDEIVSGSGEPVNAMEAQVLTVALGITMDELFGEEPDGDTLAEVQAMALQGTGVATGAGMLPDPQKVPNITQEELDKSLARLYYYAKCLRALG